MWFRRYFLGLIIRGSLVRAQVGPQSGQKVLAKARTFFVKQTEGEKFMLSSTEVSPGGTTKNPFKSQIWKSFLI